MELSVIKSFIVLALIVDLSVKPARYSVEKLATHEMKTMSEQEGPNKVIPFYTKNDNTKTRTTNNRSLIILVIPLAIVKS